MLLHSYVDLRMMDYGYAHPLIQISISSDF